MRYPNYAPQVREQLLAIEDRINEIVQAHLAAGHNSPEADAELAFLIGKRQYLCSH